MIMMQLLMLVQYVFALGVLIYASMLDFRKREVSNRVWIFAYPIGCALTLAALVFDSLNIHTIVLSLGFSIAIGFVLLYFGFYGGADAKALIFVGLTVPTLPFNFSPILGAPVLPPVLTMFCNSVLLSMVYPLSVFILNLKDALKGNNMFEEIKVTTHEKLLLLFTARRIKLDKLEKSLMYFPSERVVIQEGKPTRKLLHFIKAEADLSTYFENLKENKELYKKGVLASPTIPFIVFFTFALALAPLGNLIIWTITCLLNIV